MRALEGPATGAGRKLNAILGELGQQQLSPEVARQFESYLVLLLRWNARTSLTAIRDEDGILVRHFVESIVCARVLPGEIRTLLDFGSGAGFPGIPIALCRTEIAVTLAESQTKKAAFLREAARVLGVAFAVYGGRAESVGQTFDCVILRAVDRMAEAVREGAGLVAPKGWLALLTTRGESAELQVIAGQSFAWSAGMELPGTEQRILLLGRHTS
jgi:16S rRNA (guanine527-N7)-methyltransferase